MNKDYYYVDDEEEIEDMKNLYEEFIHECVTS
jgi:hypothetical protein